MHDVVALMHEVVAWFEFTTGAVYVAYVANATIVTNSSVRNTSSEFPMPMRNGQCHNKAFERSVATMDTRKRKKVAKCWLQVVAGCNCTPYKALLLIV